MYILSKIQIIFKTFPNFSGIDSIAVWKIATRWALSDPFWRFLENTADNNSANKSASHMTCH